MRPLHGDHTARLIVEWHVVAAVFESHDVGTPYTILAKGRACDSQYSFRTSDSWGADTSAE